MTYLILYLAVTIAGYFIGTKLKRSGQSLPWVGKTQTVVIVVLVFLMGSRIGANDEIEGSDIWVAIDVDVLELFEGGTVEWDGVAIVIGGCANARGPGEALSEGCAHEKDIIAI